QADLQSLAPYLAVGLGLRGVLAVCRGNADTGLEALQRCLAALRDTRYQLLTTALTIPLLEACAATGRAEEGLTLAAETIRRVEAKGERSYLPELLRAKGRLLLSTPHSEGAEACFRMSIDLSRSQGALAWELRTATEWAALLAARGRPADARALLRP